MNTYETVALVLVLVAFITYRQTRWLPVTLGKLFRMPIIFVAAGLLQIPVTSQQLPGGWRLGTPDVVLIAAELALAVVVGWLMGRLTQVATVNDVVSSRLGAAGIAVWLGFFVLRFGLEFGGSGLHAPLATLPVVIFFVVATIKITQAVVVRRRVADHQLTEPGGAVAAASGAARARDAERF